MTKYDVLLIIEGEIATTHLIERILLACEPYGIRYRKRFLSALVIQDFSLNTIPLFVRCGDPTLKYWIDLLCRANHPYLYYIDDNFWRIQGEAPLARYYQHPVIRHSLEYAVSHAHCVLANSDELALFLSRYNKCIKVLPSFFDFSLIEGCYRHSCQEVRIGFAGSPSRVDDLEIIRPVIFPILKSFPNAVFEFAGAMPHGLDTSDRVRFFEHTSNYSQFVRFQTERNWTIGLAPLVDNEANRCKTNNKYREYGACGIPAVYSKVEPYNKSVTHGVTGLLVDNLAESWIAAINRLIENSSERDGIAERAYKDVKDKHCVERVSVVWANTFEVVDRYIKAHPSVPLSIVSKPTIFEIFRFKLNSLRMQLLTAYNTGGIPLVMRKAMARIFKNIKPN